MGGKGDFKVVIAGGSISGLTLANMLQMHDIDFVVLEAYPDIAPQVGASIGILPHGNRIMDQLGLYGNITALCPPLDSFHFRDKTGHIISEFYGMNHSMCERHGYSINFLDRQQVLQVLYDNIKDKTKVLTSKRVKNVDVSDDGVSVRTDDGSTYHGDMLIGADGIHSTVRSEMWRIADAQLPEWIPSDEKTSVPVDTLCIFGISKPCEGIDPGASNSVFRKHQSYIINGGPEGRVYWFYFEKLPKCVYGDDIPTYTKEDENKLLAVHENDPITPTLRFKTLLDRRITSVMVPLQEYVFRKWYYKRIFTLGDSAHKFNPISGHGGNACIESAATLINNLLPVLDAARRRGTKPTVGELGQVFAQTQEIRQDRAQLLKEHSHDQQRMEALDSPLHELAAFYLVPLMDNEDITFKFSGNMPLAEKLHTVPIRPVPRLVPYKDELLSAPRRRGAATKWLLIAFYLLIAGLVHYGMWVRSASYGLDRHLGTILTTGHFVPDPGFRLKRTYTGIQAIDNYLAFLAAIFMTGVNGWDRTFGMLQLYFLGMLVQPIAVYTVEAFRRRNKVTPLALMTVWMTLVQSAGVGIYMPIYYAVYTFVSEPEPYWWPFSREVKIQHARSLMAALMLGYTLPTVLMFIPWGSPEAVQNFEALWQVGPMLVPLLTSLFGWWYARSHKVKVVSPTARQVFPDVAPLQQVYVVSGVLGVLLHVYCLARISSSPDLSFAAVFWPDLSAQPKELGPGLTALFLTDFWGFVVASWAWLIMAVWDVRRMGRSTVDVTKAAALITLGHVFVGPGATMSAVWYWREVAMAKTTFAEI